MRTLGTIRGYASPFGVLSAPIGLGEPFRAIVRPGAYGALVNQIRATVLHGDRWIGGTWDRSLRLWQDNHGLAIELDIPATPDGVGLRNMVGAAGGINAMSIGLTILKSVISYDDDDLPIHDVTRAEIDHVTICDCGAFVGACCWVAGTPADRMPLDIAAAARRWHLGRIDCDQKQAADRKMVANFLATPGARERFFAKAG